MKLKNVSLFVIRRDTLMLDILKTIKKSRKILGMNCRNLEYIRPHNLKRAKRIADDKILSKKILKKGDLPVPKLLATIKSHKELEQFDWNSLPNSFVLKPNRGLGGEGIIVVYGKKKNSHDTWIKADGSKMTIEDMKNHIRNILDGTYSLSNTPDIAFFEERLKLLKLFKPYSYKGVPDIRVIIFNKVPVMAMLRLPTKHSNGKANLKQGAIGVGIDMNNGTTTNAIFRGKTIEYLPGTRLLLSGIKIPYWQDILHLAVQAQKISGLGFLGADVAIDREKGPVFLELNARPGLAIQIANLDGLKGRLERVADLDIKTIKRGVRVGMDLFGGDIEEELEDISGKKVIETIEKVKLVGRNDKIIELDAKVDTGAGWSSIDIELAKQLGFSEVVEKFDELSLNYEQLKELTKEERWDKVNHISNLARTGIVHSSHGTTYRPMVRIHLVIDKLQVPAIVSIIDRSRLKYPMLIGRRDLKKFLIEVK